MPSSSPSDAPSLTPSKVPSDTPTGEPTFSIKPSPSPSRAPIAPTSLPTTLAPTIAATDAPTATVCPDTCLGDRTIRFTVEKLDFKGKGCAYASRWDELVESRCAIPEFSLNCCDTCCTECPGDYTEKKFEIAGIDGRKSCAWAARKKTAERCQYPEVAANCCETCALTLN
mmetsp:Transcript_22446/g.25533  ORF Transcript_22446/g.25533 Transcript_22446/m.25533 type:complete len:171 (+) Transcript_22446:1-513(+)